MARPPSRPYVVKRMPMGHGEVHFLMRSRKRSNRKGAKRHEHLVMWSPRERVLICTCPGYNFRKVCSGTREILAGRVR